MIFDTHAHYDDEQFEEDRDLLLKEVFSSNIGFITDVGASMESSRLAVALADGWDGMYAAVGVHPDNTGSMTETDIEELSQLARHIKVRAIGEIGLDYYWDNAPRDVQKKWFERQLELAKELELPVIIHSREAAADTMEIMKKAHENGIKGVIHCYSYSAQMAKEYVSMGYFLGIGGVVTFKNARVIKEVTEQTPIESILLETDCPYLAPTPHRGKRNCSLYLKEVVRQIAELKNLTEKQVEDITTENAKRFYGV